MNNLARRNLIKLAAGGVGGILSRGTRFLYTDEGPYRPVGDIPYADDLTNSGAAVGDKIQISGILRDSQGRAIHASHVIIWQADANGNYRHPNAPNQSLLDPNFRYYARVKTIENGQYSFTTLMPRSYVHRGIKRAPHIHFEMSCTEGVRMTSELYFDREQDRRAREQDLVWLHRDKDRRSSLIAGKADEGKPRDGHVVPYQFDMVLQGPLQPVCSTY